jgi:hypothetical protein
MFLESITILVGDKNACNLLKKLDLDFAFFQSENKIDDLFTDCKFNLK